MTNCSFKFLFKNAICLIFELLNYVSATKFMKVELFLQSYCITLTNIKKMCFGYLGTSKRKEKFSGLRLTVQSNSFFPIGEISNKINLFWNFNIMSLKALKMRRIWLSCVGTNGKTGINFNCEGRWLSAQVTWALSAGEVTELLICTTATHCIAYECRHYTSRKWFQESITNLIFPLTDLK